MSAFWFTSHLVSAGLASLVFLSGACADAGRLAPRSRPLTEQQFQALVIREGLQTLVTQGDWQEAAWRLADRGRIHDFLAFEAQMLWVMANERVVHAELIKHDVYLVRFESGLQGVFKATDQLDAAEADAEAFVYVLDRTLDLRIVPVSMRGGPQFVLFNGEVLSMNSGSVQAYIPRARLGTCCYISRPYGDERMYLLDHLLGQSDRHSGNWLWSEYDRVIAIDNAMIEGVPSADRWRRQWGILFPPTVPFERHGLSVSASKRHRLSASLFQRLRRSVDSGAIQSAHLASRSPSPLARVLARARGLLALGPASSMAGLECRAYFGRVRP